MNFMAHPSPRRPRARLPLLAALLGLAAAGGCRARMADASASPPDSAPPVQVKAVVVDEKPMPRTLRLAGTLIPSEDSDVAAGVAGKVLATFVERGSYVKKGQPLARLDAR